jgi:hypothetical protein
VFGFICDNIATGRYSLVAQRALEGEARLALERMRKRAACCAALAAVGDCSHQLPRRARIN